jgi:hypothetical protein
MASRLHLMLSPALCVCRIQRALQLPPVPFVEGARFLDIRVIKAGFKDPQSYK